MKRRILFVIAALGMATGCSSSGSPVAPIVGAATTVPVSTITPLPVVTATPLPVSTATPVAATQHLYVGAQEFGTLEFSLPLSASSQPVVNDANTTALAVDTSGDLMNGAGGTLQYFPGPFSMSSSFTAQFSSTSESVNQLAFATSGNLFLTSGETIVTEYAPPYTNASVAIAEISNPALTNANGVALDSSGKLYVSNDNSNQTSNIVVLSAPYMGTATVTSTLTPRNYVGLALSATQLFAVNFTSGTSGSVDVYNLPITASSAPAFSIGSPLVEPEAAAIDAAGDLYVTDFSTDALYVYAPPFSATSAPVVTLHNIGEELSTGNLAIGK